MVVHANRAAYDVLVDRTTKWGNPFKHTSLWMVKPEFRAQTRAEAIAKFEIWIHTQAHLIAALPELKDRVLACWCDPLPCHAKVLVRLANGLCATCDEPYTEPPTARAMICSNGFHCCRQCMWSDGRVTQHCPLHAGDADEEKT